MNSTVQQYDDIIAKCTDIFTRKMHDYGTAWRILRTTSITDQIYIKAKRIKTIEEVEESKVDEGVEPEYIGIINYCLMGLIQLEWGTAEEPHTDNEKVKKAYLNYFEKTKELMLAKNHDYGEAWRDMRVSSFTDLILMKLLRIKQIEHNKGKTLVSEGIDANYMDIINYSVFALIQLEEEQR
ncbi:DUF1599 domain-containing protein [Salibacter halophilus]|uniref:DUF1599 domain-containing protein n=1 Tax=Salibacter halophilus TaxID=1803916 RepID=A0A6N6M7H2_9FLAO|nr:DUF1599 domain-containing protein [Salibacter halophilus]KAB1064452.1 DUF1599 domain-containing protein [Salibacter halophilus]